MTNKKGIKKRIPWNKGLTKETDERIKSSWNKGLKGLRWQKVSAMISHNKENGVWNKGKKRPEISGEKHPMYGKKHSKKTLLKISKSLKGKLAWNKGISHTKEHIKNSSESHLKYL